MSRHNDQEQNKNTLKNDFSNIRDKAQETGAAIAKTASHLTDNLKEGAKNAYGKASDRASDAYYDAKDRASDAYERVKDVAQDSYQRVKTTVIDAEENVVQYVKKHPVKAVGFAILGGIILSHLFRKD